MVSDFFLAIAMVSDRTYYYHKKDMGLNLSWFKNNMLKKEVRGYKILAKNNN